MQSIIARDRKDRCYICGRYCYTQEHHMMHGTANRRNAEHFGLKVHLCPTCHHRAHCNPESGFDQVLKKVAQREFEQQWGHEEWMKVFGKNYL